MADDISLLNLDEGTDDPRQARSQLLEAVRRANAFTVIYGSGMADKASEIVSANAAGKPLLIIGPIHIGSAVVLNVPIVDSESRLFTDASLITIDNGQAVRPEWFGLTAGNIMRAVNALPASGGVVKLSVRRYLQSYYTVTDDGTTAVPGVDYLVKPNVKIIGERRPVTSTSKNRLVDGSGSIVTGPFFAFAPGLHVENVGVDSGADVCNAYYGGGYRDAFVTFKPNHTSPPSNVLGLTLRNVLGLCDTPASPVHAILMEGYDWVDFSDVQGYFGVHGVVVKSRYVNGSGVYAYGNESEGFIVKSDSYAPNNVVNVSNVHVRAADGVVPNDSGRGVQILTSASAPLAGVNITNIYAYRKAVALEFLGASGSLSDCNVTGLISESCDTGITFAGAVLRRCKVVGAVVNNGSQAISAGGPGDYSNSVSGLTATNMAADAISLSGKLTLGLCHFENVLTAGTVCIRVADTAGARIGKLTYLAASILGFENSTPALQNSWMDFGGAPPFAVIYMDGLVQFNGKIKSGVGSTLFTLPLWLRPSYSITLIAMGYTGSAYLPIQIIVNTDGTVVAANYPTGAGSYISLDGVQFNDAYLAS